MSRARTRCARIEERTLRIGFGIKCASEREIGLPELLALQPALNRGEPIPLGPLTSHQFFGLNHAKAIAGSRLRVNLRATRARRRWSVLLQPSGNDPKRSEERRVGKECRSRWSQYH